MKFPGSEALLVICINNSNNVKRVVIRIGNGFSALIGKYSQRLFLSVLGINSLLFFTSYRFRAISLLCDNQQSLCGNQHIMACQGLARAPLSIRRQITSGLWFPSCRSQNRAVSLGPFNHPVKERALHGVTR
jgi:hypothetical protein